MALLVAHPVIDVVVCDDGLQHLALARDIEVIAFDDRGAGNAWLLPAGPLREPLQTVAGAVCQLVLYTAGVRSTPLPGHLGQRRLRGLIPWDAWRQGDTLALPLEHLRGQDIVACAGLARPEPFFRALEAADMRVHRLPLPDHHSFTSAPWPASARHVIVTEKDAVKLGALLKPYPVATPQVWVAPLDFNIEPSFFAALDAALSPWKPHGYTSD